MGDNFLYLTNIGIDTYQYAVVFMRRDWHTCRAEGFNAMTRVRVCTNNKSIIPKLAKEILTMLSKLKEESNFQFNIQLKGKL